MVTPLAYRRKIRMILNQIVKRGKYRIDNQRNLRDRNPDNSRTHHFITRQTPLSRNDKRGSTNMPTF